MTVNEKLLGGKMMNGVQINGKIYIEEPDVREAVNAALATNTQRNERIAELERSLSEAVQERDRERREHVQWTVDHQRDTNAAWSRVNDAEKARDICRDAALSGSTQIIELHRQLRASAEYAEKLKDAADGRMVTLLMDAAFALSKVQPKNMLAGTLERAAAKLREAHKVVHLSKNTIPESQGASETLAHRRSERTETDGGAGAATIAHPASEFHGVSSQSDIMDAGYILAMRLLQSDLWKGLDDSERGAAAGFLLQSMGLRRNECNRWPCVNSPIVNGRCHNGHESGNSQGTEP